MKLRSFLAAGALLVTGLSAHAATTYAVTVSEGLTGPSGFNTTAGNPFATPTATSNTAAAMFTYTGALNFDNTATQNGPGNTGDLNSAFGFSTANVSNYMMVGTGPETVTYPNPGGTVVANYSTLASFLTSSGSASNFDYGSYFTFDLGALPAGTVLTITHDDGISVYQGGTEIGTSVSGPTSVTTDVIDVTNSGDTMLRYARENGTPSILEVTAVTPEPSSLALLGTGVLGIAGLMRKRLKLGMA